MPLANVTALCIEKARRLARGRFTNEKYRDRWVQEHLNNRLNEGEELKRQDSRKGPFEEDEAMLQGPL